VLLGEQFPVDVSFVNPLPVYLYKPKFIVEGPGFGQPVKITLATVGPNQEVKARVTMTSVRAGEKTIAAKFSSKELSDVDGFYTLNVTQPGADVTDSDDPLAD